MTETCFECGKEAHHNHHVVPQALGGTKTVPLCTDCHGKVHNIDYTNWKALQAAGIAAAKAAGKIWGGREKGSYTKINPDVEAAIKEMNGNGIPKARIAKELNLTRQSVYRVLGSWERK